MTDAAKPDPDLKTPTPLEVQGGIYRRGVAGLRPSVPTDYDQLKAQARAKLSPQAFGYVNGGAGRGQTQHRNNDALKAFRVTPQMLSGVAHQRTPPELFGHTLASPLMLAPIGALDLMGPNTDCHVAAAAAQTQTLLTLSNQASLPMESSAKILRGAPFLFQLYWSKDDALVESLVKRAEACGAIGVVVTLDTTQLGWRPQDLNQAYLPFIQGRGIAQYTSDPVFMGKLDETLEPTSSPPLRLSTLITALAQARRVPGSTLNNLLTGRSRRAVQRFIQTYSRPDLTWEDLPRIRAWTNLPIIVKGIQSTADAQRAVDVADALWVSNHGGRQVDGAIGSFDALQAIAALKLGMPLIFDSGVRSGADAQKALIAGADLVAIGRPYAYAAALAGQAGVTALIEHFNAELGLQFGLSGVYTSHATLE